MSFSIWRLGFMNDDQKYARGCVLYLNSFCMMSGNVRTKGAWKHLGWGFWWRKKKRKRHLRIVK